MATGVAIANARGKADSKSLKDTTVLTNPILDTTNFLTADEAYKLVTTNDSVKDEIAAGIYYKDIGSRKNLTVAESDVEYAGSIDSVKNVYKSKAVTNIRKLVTEGYIKIERANQNVSITTEKENL